MGILRAVARTLLSVRLQDNLRLQGYQRRVLGARDFVRWNAILFNAWLRERRNRGKYPVLNEGGLRNTRKSNTVFIFGSGYSLHDITPAEWRHFEAHDTLGFTTFVYQRWVRMDYYLLRGWIEFPIGTLKWRAHTRDFVKVLNANPLFRHSILLVQGDYSAQFCNSLIGYRLLRPDTRILRFFSARTPGPPTRSLRDGVRHGCGTLCDAVNIAYCLGWKEIVLVGVDLYDSRYFCLDPDQTLGVDHQTSTLKVAEYTAHGIRYDQPHSTVRNGMVELMEEWRGLFERDGVQMSVYNPRSLLARVMPVYQRDHQGG